MTPLDAQLIAALDLGYALIPLAGDRGGCDQAALVRAQAGVVDVLQTPPGCASIASRFERPTGAPSLYLPWTARRREVRVDPLDALIAMLAWPDPQDDDLQVRP